MVQVLVVDDEPGIEDGIVQYFKEKKRDKEFKFEFALNGVEAQKVLKKSGKIEVIISGIGLVEKDGLDFVKLCQEMHPDAERIFISGDNDIDNIRRGMQQGAFDFLVKPLDLKDLESSIEKAVGHVKRKREVRELKRKNDLLSRYNKGQENKIIGIEHLDEIVQVSAAMFHNMKEGVIITDSSGVIVAVNPGFELITGYSLKEVLGKKASVLKSNRHDEDFYKSLWKTLLEKGVWRGEVWNRKKNGEIYPETLSIVRIENLNGEVDMYAGVFSDISGQKEQEEAIQRRAFHDPLTDLPNRLLFLDRLETAIEHAIRKSSILAVVFLDLDNFKNVNNTSGHKAGDEILMDVSLFLNSSFRNTDTVSRYGGDKFVVILDELHDEKEGEEIIKSTLYNFSQFYKEEVKQWKISLSLGICFYPDQATSPEALIENADEAMYVAKKKGKNGYSIFEPSMSKDKG